MRFHDFREGPKIKRFLKRTTIKLNSEDFRTAKIRIFEPKTFFVFLVLVLGPTGSEPIDPCAAILAHTLY